MTTPGLLVEDYNGISRGSEHPSIGRAATCEWAVEASEWNPGIGLSRIADRCIRRFLCGHLQGVELVWL